jgi:hypothetical protein
VLLDLQNGWNYTPNSKAITPVQVAPSVAISRRVGKLISVIVGDWVFEYVSFLAGFDDGTATDESSKAHGVATLTGVTVDPTVSQWTGQSLKNTGTFGNNAAWAATHDWSLSAANSDQFTIEGYWSFASATPVNSILIAVDSGTPTFQFRFWVTASGELEFLGSTTGGSYDWTAATSSGLTWSANTFYHLAVDKDATGKVRVYRDGSMVASSTPSNSAMVDLYPANSIPLTVLGGALVGSFAGWADEVRITKGIARYATDAGFAPPAFKFGRSHGHKPSVGVKRPKNIPFTLSQLITLPRAAAKIIAVASAHIATLQRAVGKLIQEVQAETITLAPQVSRGQIISVASAQFVTLARRITKIIMATSAQAVTLLRTTGKIISSASPEVVTLIRATGRIISATQSETVTLARLAAHIITLASASAITLAKSVGKIVSATIGQTVSLTKNVGHIVSVAWSEVVTLAAVRSTTLIVISTAQAVTLKRNVGKILSATNATVVTLTRAVGKIVLVTQAQTVTFKNAIARIISFAQAETVTATKNIGHIITASAVGSTVTLIRSMGKIATASIGQVLTLARAAVRVISVATAEVITLIRSTGRAITFSQAVVASLMRSTGHIVSVSFAGVVTLARAVGRTISVTSSETITLIRATGKLLTTMLIGETVSLVRSIGHKIAVSSAQTLTLIRSVGHAIAVSSAEAATLTRSTGKLLSATGAQTATLLRSIGKIATASIGQAVTLLRSTGHIVTVAISEAVTLIRSAGHAIAATSAETVTLLLSTGKRLTATVGQTITLLRAVGKIITVSTSETVALTKSAGHRVTVALSEAATLSRNVGHFISATSAQVVTMARSTGKLITLSGAQVLTVLRSIAKTITVSISEVATLTRSVGHRVTATSAEAVTLVRSVGHFVSVVQSEATSLLRSTGKVLTASWAEVITLRRSTGHIISVAWVQYVTRNTITVKLFTAIGASSITVQRAIGHAAAVAQAHIITLTRAIAHAISATASEAVTLKRSAGKIVSATQAQTVSLIRAVGHKITVASAQLITLVRSVGHRVSVSSAETVRLTRSTGKLISFSQAIVATITRSTGKLIVLATGQMASLRMAIGHRANVAQTQVVSLKRAIGKTISLDGDPLWNDVVFLSGFDGPTYSNDFVNERTSQHSYQAYSAIYDEAPTSKKFGRSGVQLLGSDSRINFASPTWNLCPHGDSEFTIECFINLYDSPTGQTRTICSVAGDGSPAPGHLHWHAYISSGSIYFTMRPDGTGNTALNAVSASLSWTQHQWYHIVIVYRAGTFFFYRDGSLINNQSGFGFTTVDPISDTVFFVVGNFSADSSYNLGPHGYLDELRITLGARYYPSSTYDVPTAPYPRVGEGIRSVGSIIRAVDKIVDVIAQSQVVTLTKVLVLNAFEFVTGQVVGITKAIAKFIFLPNCRPWILASGFWDDQGVWHDRSFWIDDHVAWILESGYWDDLGQWVDDAAWYNAHWILRTGYWDDTGAWRDNALWLMDRPVECSTMNVTLTKNVGLSAFEIDNPLIASLMRAVYINVVAQFGAIIEFASEVFRGVLIEIVQEQVLDLKKEIAHLIEIAQDQIVSAGHDISTAISVVSNQIVRLGRNMFINFAIATGTIVRISRRIGHQVLIAPGQTIMLLRRMVHRISIQQTSVASLRRAIAKPLTKISSGEIVKLTKAATKTFITSVGEIVTIVRHFSHGQIISFAVASVVTLRTLPEKVFAVLIGQTQQVQRATRRTISTALAPLVRLGRRFPFKITAFQVGQIITTSRYKGAYKVITSTLGHAITMRRSIIHIRRYVRPQRVRLTRATQKLSLGMGLYQLVTETKLKFKVFTILRPQLITVGRKMAHRITIPFIALVTLTKRVRLPTFDISQELLTKFGINVLKPFSIAMGQIVRMGRAYTLAVVVPISQIVTLFRDFNRSIRRRAHLKWQGLPARTLDAQPPSPILAADTETDVNLKAVSRVVDEDKDVKLQADTNIDQTLKAE